MAGVSWLDATFLPQDRIKLDGISEEAAALSPNTPTDTATVAVVGSSSAASHSDHVHGVPQKFRLISIPWSKNAADGAAADATTEHVVFRASPAMTISSIRFIPDAGLTANDTNYATLKVARRDGAGGASAAVATKTTQTTGTGNWTAFVGVSLGSLTNTALAAEALITFEITKTAAGVVVPSGHLEIYVTVD